MTIEITESMINAVRAYVPAPCPRESARRAVERLLNMPEVRKAFERELNVPITDEPDGIGVKVIDKDEDVWVRTSLGWDCNSQRIFGASWLKILGWYGPLRRLPS